MKRVMKANVKVEEAPGDCLDVTARNGVYTHEDTIRLNRDEARVLIGWLEEWLEQPSLALVEREEQRHNDNAALS